MKLSIIIVSFNVKSYLEQCLVSVRRACRGIEAEVWVVDNASSDGTVDYIAPRFPEVRWIKNTENKGFSRANNMAIARSEGEYVLLLNPDTIVGEDVLAGCLAFMDAHPGAGATGVAMLKDDGDFAWESRRGLPTPFTSFCKMSGLCALFPESRRFGRYYMRYLDRSETNPIDVVSGAFCMVRRSALDKAGLLDEDFFMYGEDIDLSYRLLQCGYQNYYQPLRILHYKGESTHKSSFRYVHVFYKAMLIFFDKHYRRSNPWLTPVIRSAVVARAFLDLCLRQRERLFKWFCPRGRRRSCKSYLFLGRPDAVEAACKLSLEHGLKMDFVVADEAGMPDGHLGASVSCKGYDYVVYDTGAYSYAKVLELLARGAETGKVRLGTYSMETGKLVTMSRVYDGGKEQACGSGTVK